jgi:purine-binding chemotaxis protein CheW
VTRPGDAPSVEAAALLLARAERLRRPPAAEDEAGQAWIAEFPLADQRWAVPLAALRAALPLRMVRPVPLAPPHVVGILRWQGRIVTAVSLASLLGVRGWRQDPAVLLVVDAGGERLCALDCEAIPRPIALAHAALDKARAAADGPVAEIVPPDGKPIRFVDPARLLARVPEASAS